MSSCEKVFCTSGDDNGGTGECTQNYTTLKTSMNYWYGDKPNANPPNNKYIDFETGTTYETETTDCDMVISGDDNGIIFNGLNGTAFSYSNYTGKDWKDGLCDSYFLPDNNRGEPTKTSMSVTSNATTGDHLIYFKNRNGKYGLVWLTLADYTIEDWWQIDEMHIAIQK